MLQLGKYIISILRIYFFFKNNLQKKMKEQLISTFFLKNDVPYYTQLDDIMEMNVRGPGYSTQGIPLIFK